MKIKDIAKLAGVSVATVSRVLNNKEDVNSKTRKRILELIKNNDYRPSAIARNLVKNENNTIGVIVPDIKNLYFSNIINELTNISNDRGLNLLLGCSNEDFDIQNNYIDLFLKERVKGIIIVVTKNSNYKIEYFKELIKKIPVVFLDRKISDDFSGVFIENYQTTYNSIKKMIDNGARNIAFISGPLDVSTANERFKAYKDVLVNNRIKYDESNVFYGDFSMESGYKIGKEIIKKDIDAVYISNNLMTFGFMKALKELNENITKYQISTFENNEILDFMNKNIHSNIIPFNKFSEIAIELLNDLIYKNKEKEILEIFPIEK
ncbi:LacI family DNA-binding transcriptional regulator [Streptobacillus canis]|uniref:LacI family DNA-binding transcriptional regulator n=1 Tax=Streptobacillus canis TaxID=2678686 RepID=UPI0012E145E1|nr:LacI family DNA-binding transcriptional regulator [Streptobacillus canis]